MFQDAVTKYMLELHEKKHRNSNILKFLDKANMGVSFVFCCTLVATIRTIIGHFRISGKIFEPNCM